MGNIVSFTITDYEKTAEIISVLRSASEINAVVFCSVKDLIIFCVSYDNNGKMISLFFAEHVIKNIKNINQHTMESGAQRVFLAKLQKTVFFYPL